MATVGDRSGMGDDGGGDKGNLIKVNKITKLLIT